MQLSHYDFLLLVQSKQFPLIHFNERPAGIGIDTIVIHSMYCAGQKRPNDALSCFRSLDQSKVSSHFSIDRKGGLWQHVASEYRAWHAGVSSLPACGKEGSARENVNDFSIGIELIGVWGQRFRASQYRCLVRLVEALMKEFPIRNIVSHQRIAPDRKKDPGPSFRWNILKRALRNSKPAVRIIP